MTTKSVVMIKRRTERRVLRVKKVTNLHAAEDSDATGASLAHREKKNRSPQFRTKEVNNQHQWTLLLKTRNIIVNIY